MQRISNCIKEEKKVSWIYKKKGNVLHAEPKKINRQIKIDE